MAEEAEIQYKDISDLRKDLDMIKKRKEMPANELYQTVQSMAMTMSDMLEIFVAAAEQMKQEEKFGGTDAKKHEMIIAKLDRIANQNKTIAEGIITLVDTVKAESSLKQDEQAFKPEPETKPLQENPFEKAQPDWQPKPERKQTMPSFSPQPAPPPSFSPQTMQSFQPPAPNLAPPENLAPPLPPPDYGMPSYGMPNLQPSPEPELDFPEEPFPLDEEQPKKKGIFGMFKK